MVWKPCLCTCKFSSEWDSNPQMREKNRYAKLIIWTQRGINGGFECFSWCFITSRSWRDVKFLSILISEQLSGGAGSSQLRDADLLPGAHLGLQDTAGQETWRDNERQAALRGGSVSSLHSPSRRSVPCRLSWRNCSHSWWSLLTRTRRWCW